MEQTRSRSAGSHFHNARRALLVLLLVTAALPAAAQDFPAWLTRGEWFVRGEIGAAEIHGTGGLSDADLDSLWRGVRVGRAFGEDGMIAFDIGLARGSSDGGFRTSTGGLELRAFARSRVTPFIRLELGSMTDRLGWCGMGGVGGGVTIRVSGPLALRAGAMSNGHCEGDHSHGPSGAFVGVDLRW